MSTIFSNGGPSVVTAFSAVSPRSVWIQSVEEDLRVGPTTTETRLGRARKPTPVFSAAAAVILATQLSSVEPVCATPDTSAHIQINSVQPTAIEVSIGDLPIIGKLLSGTYARMDTEAVNAVGRALGSETKRSVSITSPADKTAAIKELASKGHLEFDIDGVINTHVDVDVATVRPEELTVKVTSPLIPTLPFKNKANALENDLKLKKDGKPSDWVVEINLGDGSSVFKNSKTGASQLNRPANI